MGKSRGWVSMGHDTAIFAMEESIRRSMGQPVYRQAQRLRIVEPEQHPTGSVHLGILCSRLVMRAPKAFGDRDQKTGVRRGAPEASSWTQIVQAVSNVWNQL
jgi:hypothetical protein